MALPITFWFFANCFTFGLRSLAMSHTVRSFAYGDTFRTVEHLTSFIRAFDFAFGLFALNIADSVLGLCARGMALRRLANRVTDGFNNNRNPINFCPIRRSENSMPPSMLMEM